MHLTSFSALTQNRIKKIKYKEGLPPNLVCAYFSVGYIIMGESLKFKEYCNRTIPAQYSDRVFGEISSPKILTLRGKMCVFCVSFISLPHVMLLSSDHSLILIFYYYSIYTFFFRGQRNRVNSIII